MITIEYDKKACAIKVQGHAGSAAAGQDLVCAGCSMLFYGLANALLDLCPPPQSPERVGFPGTSETSDAGFPAARTRSGGGSKYGGSKRYDFKAAAGDARVAWMPEKPWDQARAKLIFASYASGFRALAGKYPDHVCYTEK